MPKLSWQQAAAWRVHRHHLVQPKPRSRMLAVVRSLCGLQAQLMSSAELTLWARLENLVSPSRSARPLARPHAGQNVGHARHPAPASRNRIAALACGPRHQPPVSEARGMAEIVLRNQHGPTRPADRRHRRRAGRQSTHTGRTRARGTSTALKGRRSAPRSRRAVGAPS